MNRVRLSLALVLAAMLSITLTSTASAHARYKSSTPGKGEVVAATPARVEITFTQNIQKVAGTYGIDVAKDRGESVTAGPAVVDDNDRTKMSVPLQPNLEAGRYVVNFKNVSDDDGDPFNGAFSFYVNKQPNAIDLDNDRQLESVGAETETAPTTETPGVNGTPANAVTPPSGATLAAGSATARAAAALGTQAAPTATAVSGGTSSSSDGGSNTTLIVIIAAIVAAVAVVGVGGWMLTRKRA